jgi:hypothetical protein
VDTNKKLIVSPIKRNSNEIENDLSSLEFLTPKEYPDFINDIKCEFSESYSIDNRKLKSLDNELKKEEQKLQKRKQPVRRQSQAKKKQMIDSQSEEDDDDLIRPLK